MIVKGANVTLDVFITNALIAALNRTSVRQRQYTLRQLWTLLVPELQATGYWPSIEFTDYDYGLDLETPSLKMFRDILEIKSVKKDLYKNGWNIQLSRPYGKRDKWFVTVSRLGW